MTRPCRSATAASVVIAISALAATAALAQPSTPENGDARFTFHRAGDGYMRLDGKTGQVSNCTRRPSGWQCQVVPNERSALEAEIERLQADNAALKKVLLDRNLTLPNGIRTDPPASSESTHPPETRNQARLRRVMRELDKIWQRLVDMIEGVQREIMKRT
jgi:hypothetical protein